MLIYVFAIEPRNSQSSCTVPLIFEASNSEIIFFQLKDLEMMFANYQISIGIATNKVSICNDNLFIQGGGHVQRENKCFLEGRLLMEGD